MGSIHQVVLFNIRIATNCIDERDDISRENDYYPERDLIWLSNPHQTLTLP